MDAFVTSGLLVAVAEIGDRTQLLALALTLRYRQPLPILAGIVVATLANHALAGTGGKYMGEFLPGDALRWIVGLSFLAFAAWTLRPDSLSGREERDLKGAFLVTLVSFFLIEFGDKTQLATIALAARFESILPVIVGSTLGLFVANAPVVLFGEKLIDRLPLRWIRWGAAAAFAAFGIITLVGVDLPGTNP